jgi:hypothetical protein
MKDATTRAQTPQPAPTSASQPMPQPAPQPAFFDNPVIDNLIAVTLELGAELWVQRERMRIVERLLAEKGLVTAELIEAYTPSAEEAERSKAERDAFVQRVFGVFGREMVKATPDP